MEVNYTFIPEFALEEEKQRRLVMSYAGKLLEISNARTLVVGLDNDDKPFVLSSSGRLVDAVTSIHLDFYSDLDS